MSQLGWTEHYDEHYRRPYWHNTNTGETVWNRPEQRAPVRDARAYAPPCAASPWTRHYSEEHRSPYWHNERTGDTTWENPEGSCTALATVGPGSGRAGGFGGGSADGGFGGGGGAAPAGPPAGMLTGRIKSWNGEKGYGFIIPDDGTQDVFVMRKSFCPGRDGRLLVGQQVFYTTPRPTERSLQTDRVCGPAVDKGPAPGQRQGTVKMWNDEKGFGFITSTDGTDIFVMRKSFSATRDGRLTVGAMIYYDDPVQTQRTMQTHRVQGPAVVTEVRAGGFGGAPAPLAIGAPY